MSQTTSTRDPILSEGQGLALAGLGAAPLGAQYGVRARLRNAGFLFSPDHTRRLFEGAEALDSVGAEATQLRGIAQQPRSIGAAQQFADVSQRLLNVPTEDGVPLTERILRERTRRGGVIPFRGAQDTQEWGDRMDRRRARGTAAGRRFEQAALALDPDAKGLSSRQIVRNAQRPQLQYLEGLRSGNGVEALRRATGDFLIDDSRADGVGVRRSFRGTPMAPDVEPSRGLFGNWRRMRRTGDVTNQKSRDLVTMLAEGLAQKRDADAARIIYEMPEFRHMQQGADLSRLEQRTGGRWRGFFSDLRKDIGAADTDSKAEISKKLRTFLAREAGDATRLSDVGNRGGRLGQLGNLLADDHAITESGRAAKQLRRVIQGNRFAHSKVPLLAALGVGTAGLGAAANAWNSRRSGAPQG